MSAAATTVPAVELTRRVFASANGGDFDEIMEFFGPASVWDVGPWGLGTHTGKAAIRQSLEGWMGSFDEYEVEVEEVVDVGAGVVLVVATQYAHSARSPSSLRLRYAPVFLWVDGVALLVTHYRDVEEARAAAATLARSNGH